MVEMNITNAGAGWILGTSHLGHSTTLQGVPNNLPMAAVSGLLSASIKRGRNDESGAMETGTATIIMDNKNGQFSPDYGSSLNYPNVLPRRKVRISAKYAANAPWTPIYTGYIDSIKPVDNGPMDGNAQITCTDWLGKAARTTLNVGTYVSVTDYFRFLALVEAVGDDGWPVVYTVATSPENVQQATYMGVTAISALQDLGQTTRAAIFQSRDGNIVYQSRYDRWQNPGTFNDSYVFDQPGLNTALTPQVIPYTPDGFDYDLNTQNLYNEVIVNASSVPVETEGPQTASDTASQDYFGKLSLSLDLPLLDATRAACLADSLLQAYRTPRARLHSLVIDGDTSPEGRPFWDALFGLELGNTVHVVKREPAHVSVDRLMFIEGIQHDILPDLGGHTVTLQLSDQRQWSAPGWRLGHTPLGTGTYLIY